MKVPLTTRALEAVPVTQDTFAGGQHDRDHPSMLSPNEYARLVNGEIRDAGLCKTRRGRTNKTVSPGGNPQGGTFFAPLGGTPVLVQVNDGKFWTWGGSGTAWTRIGSTQLTNRTTQVSLVVLNGKLFVFDGTSDDVWSWDGAAASFTDEGNTNTDPPRSSLSCQQAGRIVASGAQTSQQDYLFFSDIFDGTTWDRNTNNKRVPTDGTEAVTAIVSYRKEEILAWTLHSTHLWNISGSSVSAFSRTTLDPRIGCAASKSIAVVGDDAFFISADKQLRTIKRTVQDIAFGVSTPVTYLNPNLMNRINKNYVNLCAGVFFDNYYLLAAPLDSNTRNSSVIAFDMLLQRPTPSGSIPVCVGEWTNIAVSEWIVTNFNGVTQLHYIDANDGKVYLMFDGETDDGANISLTVEFRANSWEMPNNDKTAHSAEIQMLDTFGTFNLSYAKDNGSFTLLSTRTIGDPNMAVLPINLPFYLPSGGILTIIPISFYAQGRSRYWQLKIVHSAGKISIKQSTIRAWVEMLTTRNGN